MSDSRLFKILYYLLDRQHATAPELAAKFEVSPRTIYRDVEALSSTGIPVYAEPGRNGGIYLFQEKLPIMSMMNLTKRKSNIKKTAI